MAGPDKIPRTPPPGGLVPGQQGFVNPPDEAVILPLPGKRPAAEPAAAERVSQGLYDFLWKVHESMEQCIRFADSKAAMVIMGASGLLGALYAAKVHHGFLVAAWPWAEAGLMGILLRACALVTFLLLPAAIAFAVWSIRPRLVKKPQRGILFWAGILEYGSPAAYREVVSRKSTVQLEEQLQTSLFQLATICRAKYFCLAWSMNLTIAGGIIGGLTALIVP